MSVRYALLGVAICAAAQPRHVVPQGPPRVPSAAAAAAHRTWCYRGRPKPACDAFWITESGLASNVLANRPDRSGPLWTLELGPMVNRNAKTAWGIAAFAAFAEGSKGEDLVSGLGIRARLRTWLTGRKSLDIAPGVVLTGTPGFSGHVALNFADYAAVTAHLVALRPPALEPDRRRLTAVFLGGRLGSGPGATVGAAIILLVVLAAPRI